MFTPQGGPRNGLTCDPSGPLLAEVVKTTSDPYVGRVSLVRVFSGTIRPDATVHVSGHFASFFGSSEHNGSATSHADHDEDERIGTLSFPLGKQQRPAPTVVAGDICAIGRLSRAETGDTLSDKSEPLVLKPWTMPEPLLPIAVQPRAKTDEDKLSVGLQRLAAEDPTLRIEQNPETHQIVLWCMGEAHSGVVLDALANRYGVAVDTVELRVPLRETFGGKANGHRPARQAVRRARPVRRLRHRGGAAAGGRRVRVRRQGGRRCGAAAIHPERGEGRPRADGEGCRRRLSDGRHPGHPASTARRTASTRRTSRSRWRAGWRCARRRRRPR